MTVALSRVVLVRGSRRTTTTTTTTLHSRAHFQLPPPPASLSFCNPRTILSRAFSKSSRPDPFARRPTAKCDPYGQGGKPLTVGEARPLLQTVEPEWMLWMDDDNGSTKEFIENDNENDLMMIPFGIVRDFWHGDYMQGSQFITHVVAAVAQMNDHYPFRVVLERYLSSREKMW